MFHMWDSDTFLCHFNELTQSFKSRRKISLLIQLNLLPVKVFLCQIYGDKYVAIFYRMPSLALLVRTTVENTIIFFMDDVCVWSDRSMRVMYYVSKVQWRWRQRGSFPGNFDIKIQNFRESNTRLIENQSNDEHFWRETESFYATGNFRLFIEYIPSKQKDALVLMLDIVKYFHNKRLVICVCECVYVSVYVRAWCYLSRSFIYKMHFCMSLSLIMDFSCKRLMWPLWTYLRNIKI